VTASAMNAASAAEPPEMIKMGKMPVYLVTLANGLLRYG
jgi:hypothetical protein